MERRYMIKISHYDEDIDNLIISSIEENEKVKKNFAFDDFVISTTGQGKIVSLEINNFSDFLEESGNNIEEIKEFLEDLKLIVLPKKESLFIGVGIENKRIPVANIPIQCINN